MDVMSIAAAGMQRDLLRLETTSQNVANVLTPGYKRQIAVGGGFVQQVDRAMQAAAPASMAIDGAAGTLRHTGNNADVALDGDGWFEVAAPEGLRYTRQGALRVDVSGRLVGANGFPMMGLAGEIVLAPGPFTIDASGQVRQDGRVAGQLKLVRFDNPGALQPAGGNLYAQGGAIPASQGMAADAGSVRTGYLENSNVNSSREMVNLAETVRHFEALTRIAQGYDDVLEKTIRKLGEF